MDPFSLRVPGTDFSSHMFLSYVRMYAVEGRKKKILQSRPSRSTNAGSQLNIRNSVGAAPMNMSEGRNGDFFYYSDSDEDESMLEETDSVSEKISLNPVDYLKSRELTGGCLNGGRLFSQRLSSEYGTRHMLTNSIMKETPVQLPSMNKIFCSSWLSHRQIVFGTKCNKLMVYDVNSRHLDQIPSLLSSDNSLPLEADCGIHSIQINPSRTLLATGARSTNDIAIYKLPTLDPVCVGEGSHKDWIFDIAWLDDQYVASGSRDGTIALWKITEDMQVEKKLSDFPTLTYMKSMSTKVCKKADRVRALGFNQRKNELIAVSSNGFTHCWDAGEFRQLFSKKLPHLLEIVCMNVDENSSVYVIGSKNHAVLLDTRTFQPVKKISARNNGSGIRSVSFRGSILTMGTSVETVHFWDMRAGKYLESSLSSNRAVSLKITPGGLHQDHTLGLEFRQPKYDTAIYTHCYDSSGTRLFTAGGPIHSCLSGSFAALFQ